MQAQSPNRSPIGKESHNDSKLVEMAKLHFFFCCLALSQTKAVTFNCRDADNLLIETGDLTVDFFTFTNRMELNKTFSTQDEPLVIKTEYDFSAMEGSNFQAAKNICENDFGYDFCGVITKYKQTDVINALPIVREVTEIFKPVCFPKSCGLDQINIVDPRPTGCNPDGIFGNCEIISQDATCTGRVAEPTDTSTCEADVIPPSSPYYVRAGLMLSFILRDCNTVIQGGQGTYCSIESGDLKAQTMLDFKGRETLDQYTVYVDTCVEAGGQICDADLTSSYVINNDGIGDIFMTDKFESFPFCISPVCKADNGDKEEIAVETFRRYASESLVTPACLEETCEVTVSSLACPTMAPSMVSADVTPSPTISREPTRTWEPTKGSMGTIKKTKPPVAVQTNQDVSESDAPGFTDAKPESDSSKETMDNEIGPTSDTATLMAANFMSLLVIFAVSLSMLFL